MGKENGKRKAAGPTRREVTVANAIGQAVAEHLNPQFSGVTSELGKITAGIGALKSELGEIKTELGGHGKKLDQLIAGTVGIGRMTKLEERVTELEKRLPPP